MSVRDGGYMIILISNTDSPSPKTESDHKCLPSTSQTTDYPSNHHAIHPAHTHNRTTTLRTASVAGKVLLYRSTLLFAEVLSRCFVNWDVGWRTVLDNERLKIPNADKHVHVLLYSGAPGSYLSPEMLHAGGDQDIFSDLETMPKFQWHEVSRMFQAIIFWAPAYTYDI